MISGNLNARAETLGVSLPESFAVQVSLDAHPLPGAFFKVRKVRIPMRAENEFRLCFGPTDSNGSLTLSREDLIAAPFERRTCS